MVYSKARARFSIDEILGKPKSNDDSINITDDNKNMKEGDYLFLFVLILCLFYFLFCRIFSRIRYSPNLFTESLLKKS